MAWQEIAIVKYEEQKRPHRLFQGESRLDGRGYEMFRSVCESYPALRRPCRLGHVLWIIDMMLKLV